MGRTGGTGKFGEMGGGVILGELGGTVENGGNWGDRWEMGKLGGCWGHREVQLGDKPALHSHWRRGWTGSLWFELPPLWGGFRVPQTQDWRVEGGGGLHKHLYWVGLLEIN